MGEMDYPSDEEKWAHCLSIPRELDLVNGKLVQKPAEELKQLRKSTQTGEVILEKAGRTEIGSANQYELELDFTDIDADRFGLELFASENEGLVLEFDRNGQTVSLNREKFEAAFGGEYGFTRSSELKIHDKVKVQVFADHSIAEVFINAGEVVFTARVFPKEESKDIKIFADGKLRCKYEKHELAQGISF